MKPRLITLSLVVAAATFLACGKKSSTPTTAPPPAPQCALSPAGLSFGSVEVGDTLEKQFTVRNTGAGTLTGTIQVPCGSFALVGDASYSLPGGASTTRAVRFAPRAGAVYACTLQVGSTACPPLVCTGTGMVPDPQCAVGPALDFLEAIREVSEQAEFADRGMARRLILISDLRQHFGPLSFYRGVPRFAAFQRSGAMARLQANLEGVTVDVLYVPRGSGGGTLDAGLAAFWREYFAGCGASPVRLRRL